MPRLAFNAAMATAAAALCARSAFANPRPLPFSYPHEQLGEGSTEIEQYVDYTPVHALSGTQGTVTYGLLQFQTEFEHGLTDRLELGLYVTYAPAAPSDFEEVPLAVEGNGMKQRLRYKLADTGAWPIDVALYGEVSENEREIELEAKAILQRRFGIMRVIANATAEEEFYFDGRHDLVLNPSAGLTFEATPSVQPGIEWWMYGEYQEENATSPRPFELGPHQYLGPALLLQFGALWWTNGVYVRLTDWNHDLDPLSGDSFGKIWIRSVVGLGF